MVATSTATASQRGPLCHIPAVPPRAVSAEARIANGDRWPSGLLRRSQVRVIGTSAKSTAMAAAVRVAERTSGWPSWPRLKGNSWA